MSRGYGNEKNQPAGPPSMTLGNMREQGVRNLIGYCLNNACRHSALIDVSGYPADIEISAWRAKCSKCGGKRVDVRPTGKRNQGCPTIGNRAQLGKSDGRLSSKCHEPRGTTSVPANSHTPQAPRAVAGSIRAQSIVGCAQLYDAAPIESPVVAGGASMISLMRGCLR